jgi:hypothetical protein
MGSDRSGTYLRGLLVPDPRLVAANVVSKTDATTPSAYTQEGSFTGLAVPDQATNLDLRTSGAQAEDGDLEIRTSRAGGIGADGAQFQWRDVAAGDTSSEYKGRDAPQLVTDFEPLLYTTSADAVALKPHVIKLASGKLLASYSTTTLGAVRMKRYDPATAAWTDASLAPHGAGTGYLPGAATITQIGSGRVLALVLAQDQVQVDLYYSDDDGDNWTLGGRRVLDAGVPDATVTSMRVAYSPASQQLSLLIMYVESGGSRDTIAQYASADLGTRFLTVDDDVSNSASLAEIMDFKDVDILPLSGAGFLVAYAGNEDPAVVDAVTNVVTLSSAFTDIAAREPVGIVSASGVGATEGSVALWREGGSIYLLHHLVDVTTPGQLSRSNDEGRTWSGAVPLALTGTHNFEGSAGTQTTYLLNYSAAMVDGRVAVVSRWVDPDTSYDSWSVIVVWRAGYGSHTGPASRGSAGLDFNDKAMCPWHSSIAGASALWLPVAEPQDVGWTPDGGAGTALLTSSGWLEITTTAGQTKAFSEVFADTAATSLFAEFQVQLDTNEGNIAAKEVAFTVDFNNNTVSFSIEIHLASSGYRVYDAKAAAYMAAAVTFDFTAGGKIRVAIDSAGNSRTWHSTLGHVSEWTVGTASTGMTDGGGAGNHNISWGHIAAAENVSHWTMVAWTNHANKWTGTSVAALAGTWANPGDVRGMPFITSPLGIVKGVSVEAIGGPSLVGETQRIAALYEYPIAAIAPTDSPSPNREWRSTGDGANVALVWDLEREAGFANSFWESSSLGAFLVRANFQTCKLQGWDGAAWQDLIVLDAAKGYTDLDFTREGRMVRPDTAGGGTANERWSPHEMHAGDTIALAKDGETTKYRKILHNAEGGWRTGTKLARLQLDADTLDGTEPASGKATIIRRNFGGVAHNVSATYRYVRLYIPAQKTADGYYRIGSLAIGPVFVFGLQYGNGWADEKRVNVSLNTLESGARRSRNMGASRRAVEVSWSDQAQDTTAIWGAAPTPDYVTGVTSGDPVASIADTAYQVLGLVERADGPSSPVVYLGRIARGAGSHIYTLDPEWMYGRVTTMDPSIDQVVGDEGVSPLFRLNRIRFEEEV